MKSEKTTIQITKQTKERLSNMGSKGDTYEDIITCLLDKYSHKEAKNEP